jgi:uncharacterized delta-60 repeat protein
LDRYGGLDRSFGAGGIVRTPIDLGDPNEDVALAVALAPDGSIVLVGVAEKGNFETDLAAVRYTPSGALDTRFSGDGILTIDAGAPDALNGVAVQPDGKIVAVGYGPSGFLVIRLLPDGALDESFGSGGIVDTNVGDPRYRDSAAAVVVLDDGRIAVVGHSDFDYPSYVPAGIDFAIVRYLPNGKTDPTFGVDGVVVTPGSQVEHAEALAATPDGKLVVVGSSGWPAIPPPCYCGADFDFHLARYLSSGALDQTFGDGGTMTTAFGDLSASASSVAVQPNGRIYVAGTAAPVVRRGQPVQADARFAVAAYNADGTLDATFGVEGKRRYDVSSGGNDWGSALVIQRSAARSGEDRLVLAGTTHGGSDDQIAAIGIDLGPPPPTPAVHCRVPRVVGLTLGRARHRLRAAHCKVGRLRRARSTRRRGRVISQHPRVGRRLPSGSRVNLVLSRGR